MGVLGRIYAQHAPAVWEAETRLLQRLGMARPVVAVQWLVTSACDLACPHCYSAAGRRSHDELTTDEAKRLLIDPLPALGSPTLVLAGGELLLRRDLPELVTYAVSRGLSWAMHTHGLHVPRFRALFRRYPPVLAAISLDGDAELHDRFRGRSGSFAGALEAVRVLKEAGCPEVVLGTTVTRLNADRLADMFPTVLDSGADTWGLHLFAPEGRGREHLELFPTPAQLRRVTAFARRRRRVFHVELCNEWGSAGPLDLLYRDQPFLCGAGRISFVVSSNGEIMPCTTTDPTESEGNLRHTPLREVWARGFTRFREPGHGACSDGGECWLQSRNGNGCRKAAFGDLEATAGSSLSAPAGSTHVPFSSRPWPASGRAALSGALESGVDLAVRGAGRLTRARGPAVLTGRIAPRLVRAAALLMVASGGGAGASTAGGEASGNAAVAAPGAPAATGPGAKTEPAAGSSQKPATAGQSSGTTSDQAAETSSGTTSDQAAETSSGATTKPATGQSSGAPSVSASPGFPSDFTVAAVPLYRALMDDDSAWTLLIRSASATTAEQSDALVAERLTEAAAQARRLGLARPDLPALARFGDRLAAHLEQRAREPRSVRPLAELRDVLDAAEAVPFYHQWLACWLWREAMRGAGDKLELIRGTDRLSGFLARIEYHARVATTLRTAYFTNGSHEFSAWRSKAAPPVGWRERGTPEAFVAGAQRAFPTATATDLAIEASLPLRLSAGSSPALLLRNGAQLTLKPGEEVLLRRLDVIAAPAGGNPVKIEHSGLGALALEPGQALHAFNAHRYLEPKARDRLKQWTDQALQEDHAAYEALSAVLPAAYPPILAGLKAKPDAAGASALRNLVVIFEE